MAFIIQIPRTSNMISCCRGEVAFPPMLSARKDISGEGRFCTAAAVTTAMDLTPLKESIAPKLKMEERQRHASGHDDCQPHRFCTDVLSTLSKQRSTGHMAVLQAPISPNLDIVMQRIRVLDVAHTREIL